MTPSVASASAAAGREGILPAIARGDAAAHRRALEAYGGLVWSVARSYLSRREDAEDASQEVFVRLCRVAHLYDPARGSEAAFVAAVARSRVIDMARRLRARPDTRAAGSAVNDRLDGRPADSGAPSVASEERGSVAEGSVVFADEARRAKEALDALPPEQQEVIRLTVHRGYTHEGVARVLGIPIGTAKTRIRAALIKLRDTLGAEGRAPALARGEGA